MTPHRSRPGSTAPSAQRCTRLRARWLVATFSTALLALACEEDGVAVAPAAESATPQSTTTDSAAVAPASDSVAPPGDIDVDAGLDCPEPPVPAPSVLPKPSTAPFVSNSSFPDCVHPGVESDCSDGWCRVPAGCFIWGSPEWEPGRGLNSEEQSPVALTHDFELSQFEVTIAQWEASGLDFAPLANGRECTDPQCPIGWVQWFDMLAHANAMSATHEPPLEPCYVVEGCQRTSDGANFYCAEFAMNAETVYECEGYRLPTRAEFQYAARAGTTTSFYSGDITVTDELQQRSCFEEPNLEPIAWYRHNSGGKTHPVGQKLPNAWGLYDMLGNASEWLHDRHRGRSPSNFPLPPRDPSLLTEDPFGELGDEVHSRDTVGGSVRGYPSLLRAASMLSGRPYFPQTAYGFRLARTLGKGTLPTLADDPATNDATP